MSDKVKWLIDNATAGVVKIVMDETGLGMSEAMSAFFSTRTYEALADPETGLYLEAPAYIHELMSCE